MKNSHCIAVVSLGWFSTKRILFKYIHWRVIYLLHFTAHAAQMAVWTAVISFWRSHLKNSRWTAPDMSCLIFTMCFSLLHIHWCLVPFPILWLPAHAVQMAIWTAVISFWRSLLKNSRWTTPDTSCLIFTMRFFTAADSLVFIHFCHSVFPRSCCSNGYLNSSYYFLEVTFEKFTMNCIWYVLVDFLWCIFHVFHIH